MGWYPKLRENLNTGLLSRGELSPGHMHSDFLVLDAVWSGLYPVSLTIVKSRYFAKFELVM